ncbi:hypothetical protein IW261DRAFT_1309063, partial [Armillaria novae-zelandiae]
DTDKLLDLTSNRFKLNQKQDMAFRIMARAYLNRKNMIDTVTSNESEPYPMRLFLTGPGGTGKTHVIKALISIMERCGDGHAFQFLAPTGSAAAINNGMTVHKAFGLKINDRKS